MRDMIAIKWYAIDVQLIRADLTDEQCSEVLCLAESKHDACIGINWDVLRIWAEHLYPED